MLTKEYYKKIKLAKIIKKRKLSFPIVIKPVNEGSSLGVKICKNILELNKAAKSLLDSGHAYLCDRTPEELKMMREKQIPPHLLPRS